jgi:MFS family permease
MGQGQSKFVFFFSSLLMAIDASSMSISLPTFADAFNVPLSSTQWVITIYMLTMASTVLVFATIGDKSNHKSVYQLGLLSFVGGSLLCLFAINYPILLFGRFILAIGASMIVATSVPIMTEVYGVDQKTKAFALLTSGSAIGAVTGPYITGYLLGLHGQQGAFILAASGMAVITILSVFRKNQIKKTSLSLDWTLYAYFCFSITTILLAINQNLFWLIIALFFSYKLTSRLLRKGYLNTINRMSSAFPLLVNLLMFASIFFHVLIPSFLQIQRNKSPELAGQAMMIYFGSIFIGTRAASYLEQFLHCRIGATLGGLISSIALLLLGLLLDQQTLPAILSLLGFAGLGLGLFIPFNGSIVLHSFSSQSGLAGGLIATSRSLGIALGVAAALQSQRIFNSYSQPFFIAAVLALTSCMISFFATRGISVDKILPSTYDEFD